MGIIRKSLRALSLLLLLAVPARAEVLSILDLGGGINNAVPPHLIADNQASSIVNFQIDPFSHGLEQRAGNAVKNGTAIGGGRAVDPFTYVQNDRDTYIIAKSSTSLYYSQDNGVSWTVLTSTLSETFLDGASGTDDKFYLVNQDDGGLSFDGTNLTYESSLPAGKYMERYENRLWIANTAANANRLFFSGLLTMTSWATSTDYIDFPEPITAVGPPLDIGLPVYTANQVWIVRGKSTLTFNPIQISGTIGCAEDRSVQNFYMNGRTVQVFLSNGEGGSEKNLWIFNGVEIAPAGDAVINTLSEISSFNSSLTEIGWDSTLEYDAGTYTFSSGNVVQDSIMTSTHNVTETTTADFQSAAHWAGFSPSAGSPVLPDGYTTAFVDDAIASNGNLTVNGNNGEGVYISELFDTGFSSANYVNVDWTTNLPEANSPSEYIKVYMRTSDIQTTNPSFLSSWLEISSTTAPNVPWRRYFQYKVELRDFFNDFCCPQNHDVVALSDISFDVVPATGASYTSNILSASSGISEWKTVSLSTSGTKGTVYLRTGNSESSISTETFVAITNGYDIPDAKPYIQFKIDFDAITDADDPDQLQFNFLRATYLSASGASQPPDSVVWDGEYWLSYAPTGETTNSKILVMNREGAFSTFDGLNIAGFTIANNNLYGGDSTDDGTGGKLRQLDFGLTDDGAAINATVSFKQNPLQLNDWEKNVSLAYFDYKVDAGTFTVTASQNYGARTKSYTLSATSGTQYNRARLEVDPSTTMKYFGLEIENNYPSSSLKIYPPLNIHFTKVRLIPR